jgi:hypothetical protein
MLLDVGKFVESINERRHRLFWLLMIFQIKILLKLLYGNEDDEVSSSTYWQDDKIKTCQSPLASKKRKGGGVSG